MYTFLKYSTIMVFAISVAVYSTAKGQTTKELTIGDKCPDLVLNNIINYKTSFAKISDFRNKLLILDFWATWCNPCVRAFPKMDSLQKMFPDKLQIISVTDQDEGTVKVFLQKMEKARNVFPVTVVGDKILNSVFKHTYLPHYVWIDENGIICAVTGEKEVTAENIQAKLEKKSVALKMKQDKVKNIDEKQSAFILANAVMDKGQTSLEAIEKSNLLYHSVLTRFIDNLPGFASISDSNRITAVNQSIAYLYSIAAGHFQWELLMPNRQKIEVSDTTLYLKCTGQYMSTKEYVADDGFDEWAKENAVCYELSVPDKIREKRFDLMLTDLNNCFGSLYGITGGLEKRKVKTLVLKRTTTEDKIKTKGVNKPYVQNAYFYGLYNEPFKYLVSDLRQYYQLSKPLIDETEYNGKVDIELDCKLSDIEQLNKELEKYGLKFFEEERDIDIVVIKVKEKDSEP